jgi:hypothetical protein
MPCCGFRSNLLLFAILKEATARPGYKPYVGPIIEVYNLCQIKSAVVLILGRKKTSQQ